MHQSCHAMLVWVTLCITVFCTVSMMLWKTAGIRSVLLLIGPAVGRRAILLFLTSRLRRLVLCILHSMFFAKEKNKNAAKNSEGSLADICDVISRDYSVVFPQF